jgi:hypothetical protein
MSAPRGIVGSEKQEAARFVDKHKFRIDARNALWDKEISSIWPSLTLFNAVKPGVYDLQMVLKTGGGIAKSKEVTIQIDVRGTEAR